MPAQILPNSQYDVFTATRSHYQSNGLSVMPTAAPYPYAAQAVCLNGGMGWDLIVATVIRKGEPPVLPSPISTNNNRVYVHGGRWGQFPITSMGGVRQYTAGIWFLFGLLVPEALNSDFMIGSIPFPGANPSELIPGTYFQYQWVNQMMTQTLIPVPTQPNLLMGIARTG